MAMVMKRALSRAFSMLLVPAVALTAAAGSAFADSNTPYPTPTVSPQAATPGPGFEPADTALADGASSDSHAPGAAYAAPDVVLTAAGSTPVAGTQPAVTHSVPWHWTVDFKYQLTSDPFVTTVGTICINFKATYHTAADTNINITLYHGGSAVGGPISYPTTGGPWQYCYYGQSTSGSYTMFFQKINNGQQVTGYGSVENHP